VSRRGEGPFGVLGSPCDPLLRGRGSVSRRARSAPESRRKALPPGFTLLEIAVALSILGVGIVSCLQIFSASLRLLDRANKETAAVREARSSMDAMLARPPEGFLDNVGRNIDRTTEEGITTRMTSWVEPTDDEGLGGPGLGVQPTHRLYHVFVSVTWQDGRGAKSYWLESLRMLPSND